jgi:uncharacterized membrane protein YphA (DoxX/SURF4 family)
VIQRLNYEHNLSSVSPGVRVARRWRESASAVFLLALRLYFFWQLFLTGKGKLSNIGRVSEFFASLGIPLPLLNAYFTASWNVSAVCC